MLGFLLWEEQQFGQNLLCKYQISLPKDPPFQLCSIAEHELKGGMIIKKGQN